MRRLLQVMAACARCRRAPTRTPWPLPSAWASRRSCARWRSCASSRTARDTWSRRWPGWNGNPGDARASTCWTVFINQQAYRPAYWKVATETMEYRRFFDVSDLIGIRVELPSVFQATHELALRVAAEIGVTGLRIDHVDGLYDPAGYLRDLQAALPSQDGTPFYVVVEKILSRREAAGALAHGGDHRLRVLRRRHRRPVRPAGVERPHGAPARPTRAPVPPSTPSCVTASGTCCASCSRAS